MEVKLDERFDQLISCIKELRRAPEQRDKSVSFDTMEANFGSTSKGGIHAGDGGGFHVSYEWIFNCNWHLLAENKS